MVTPLINITRMETAVQTMSSNCQGRISQTDLINAFQQQIHLAKATRSKGWQFKAKNYNRVTDLLRAMPPGHYDSIEDTVEFVTYFQTAGMKFRGEPEHYLSSGEWTSKILQRLHRLWHDGESPTDGIKPDALLRLEAVQDLCRIPELGESKANDLFDQGYRKVADLESLDEAVNTVLNRKQLIGLRHYRDLETRIPRAEMDDWVDLLSEVTREAASGLGLGQVRQSMVGSYRRGNIDSGDIDWYVSAEGAELPTLMDTLVETLVALGVVEAEDIISQGIKKTMMIGQMPGMGAGARHLDIFVFPPEQYPFALLYATGSKDFNLAMRNYALQHGWSLSDQAIRLGNAQGRVPSLEELVDRIGQTEILEEADIFDFLGIEWVEPASRNGEAVRTIQ